MKKEDIGITICIILVAVYVFAALWSNPLIPIVALVLIGLNYMRKEIKNTSSTKNLQSSIDESVSSSENSSLAYKADREKVTGTNPDDPLTIFLSAQKSRERKNFGDAIFELDTGLKQYPKDLLLLNGKGNVYLAMGETDEAKAIFVSAFNQMMETNGRRKDKLYIDPAMTLFRILLEEEKFDQAYDVCAACDKWFGEDKDKYIALYYDFAWYYIYDGWMEKASDLLTTFLSRKALNAVAAEWMVFALVAFDFSKKDFALSMTRIYAPKVLKIFLNDEFDFSISTPFVIKLLSAYAPDPDRSKGFEAVKKIGSSLPLEVQQTLSVFVDGGYVKQKDVMSILELLDERWTGGSWMKRRENALNELSKSPHTIEYYNEYIFLKPDSAEAYYNRGIAYNKLGQTELAIEDYSEAIRLNPDNPAFYFGRGILYSNLGQYQKAVKDLTEAIRLKPDYAALYFSRGGFYYDLGQTERAIEDYSEAVRLKPDHTSAYNNRGLAYNKLGQTERAIEDYSEAIRLKPDYTSAYYSRGNAYNRLGQTKRAIEDYSEAIRLKPDHSSAYNNRGNAYNRLGQTKRAVEDYSEAIRLKPDYSSAYNNRGLAYNKLGQTERAIEDYSEAIRLKPDYTSAYNNRGNAYNKLGQYQRAIEDYSEAIRLKPDDADAYYNEACCFALQKNAEQACRWLQLAIERGYNDWQHIKQDKEFDNIRKELCFINLLKGE